MDLMKLNLHPGCFAAQRLDKPEVMNMIGAPKHVQKALEAKVTVIPSGKVAVGEQHHTTSEEATHTAKNSGIHVSVFFGGGGWFPIFFEGPNVTEPYM